MNPFINYNKKNKIGSLSACSDCSITNPSNNDTLQYNFSIGKWINSAISAFSIGLRQLTDVAVVHHQQNQTLFDDENWWKMEKHKHTNTKNY